MPGYISSNDAASLAWRFNSITTKLDTSLIGHSVAAFQKVYSLLFVCFSSFNS